MKYQGRDVSEYNSEYLAKQIGMLKTVKTIGLVCYAFFAIVFFVMGLAQENYIASFFGPIFCFLIFGFIIIYPSVKSKGMLIELKQRKLGTFEWAELQAEIKRASVVQWVVTVVILVIIGISMMFALSDSLCSSSSKKGFVGSDGEYHAYVPEFGDDVNEWMEENW